MPPEPRFQLQPEREGLDRYLEDTEVIDWQTPAVWEKSRALCAALDSPSDADTVAAIRDFVRREIATPAPEDPLTCRASSVLREGVGVDCAGAHLIVALLRARGVAAGFGYQRLRRRGSAGSEYRLHGFACAYSVEDEHWSPVDPRPSDVDSAGLSVEPDGADGELTYDIVFARPHPAVVDVLSRAPSVEHALRFLPDAL